MVMPVIGKFSTARSEWTPQYASAGTSRSPSRSCSMRVLVISSPRDMLFDSGFSGRLFDADGAAPTSLFLDTICQAD